MQNQLALVEREILGVGGACLLNGQGAQITGQVIIIINITIIATKIQGLEV